MANNGRTYTPEIYAEAEAQEEKTGHTFRSPSRDRYPTALKDLRHYFEATPRLLVLDDEDEDDADFASCRVCRL